MDKQAEFFQETYDANKNHPAKILFGIYKGSYGKFLLSALFYLIKHSPAWVLPIVTANIINYVTAGAEDAMTGIVRNVSIMAVLIVINIPMNYLHVRLYSRAIRRVEAGLRTTLVRKLQQLSITYHKEMESGRIQSKIMRDVEAVETLSAQLFVSLLNISINLVVALSITAFRNIMVFIFFLLTVPVAALTVVAFRSKIRTRNRLFRKEMEDTSARVMEMVEMIPVTRAHAVEKLEINRMEERVGQVSEEGYKLDIVQANFGSISWAVFQVFQLICLVFTSYLALQHRMEAGDIVMYQSYFTSIVNQVSSLITLVPTISKGMESVNSIGEVLNAHDVEDNRGKQKLQRLEGNYEFRNVTYSYQDNEHKKVIDGLNLQVRRGETVALVGESGSGKSTIMSMVIGFLMPDEGQLLVDGIDMKTIHLRSYRRHIAVVPQNTILFSGSIRDNITYGMPGVADARVREVLKAANLLDVVEKLPQGLDTMIGEHGDKLSGGQRQRISIARALIRDPQVIILDEATSALDSISEKKVQDSLETLMQGRTSFIVAHRLSTIRNADKIAVIIAGKCVEFGTYDELMAKQGVFYKMKKLQA